MTINTFEILYLLELLMRGAILGLMLNMFADDRNVWYLINAHPWAIIKFYHSRVNLVVKKIAK
jgi:hypothetical protein